MSIVAAPGPKPHDPRQPRVSPADVEKRLAEILGEPSGSLAEEAAQLERAHAVLHDALQDNQAG